MREYSIDEDYELTDGDEENWLYQQCLIDDWYLFIIIENNAASIDWCRLEHD